MAEFGVSMFPTDYAIQPIELALAAEQRGFESLFFPEHTHIPASRKTPFPGGTELPKEYWHTHDPFVALGAAAAVTKKLKLGTGVCLVIERDPITLAKEVASLDMISGGRVNFDPIWSFPKPAQAGGPPILLGSQSPRTFDRVAEYCDGWMPINFPRYDLAGGLKALAEAGSKAGRGKLPVSMFGVGPNEEHIKKFL